MAEAELIGEVDGTLATVATVAGETAMAMERDMEETEVGKMAREIEEIHRSSPTKMGGMRGMSRAVHIGVKNRLQIRSVESSLGYS